MNKKLTTGFICIFFTIFAALNVVADEGDALISYNLGLSSINAGDEDGAYKFFKSACMDSEPSAKACLAWGKLAITQDNTKDIKRALGSAVMLKPKDIQARYMLAITLFEKKDWVWAEEHLFAAIEHAENKADRCLLRYYLGYALYKQKKHAEASKQLSLASKNLSPLLEQRAHFLRAVLSHKLEKNKQATVLMGLVAQGENKELATTAQNTIGYWTSFARTEGIGGNVILGMGIDTNPLGALVDELYGETVSTFDMTFRSDLILGSKGYKHGFQANFTLFTIKHLADFGASTAGLDVVPTDTNLIMFIAGGAYIFRGWGRGHEHELKLGVDAEMQLVDHLPFYQGYQNGSDMFSTLNNKHSVFSKAIGAKIWWSMASNTNSIWSLRFKIEGRPNYSYVYTHADENKTQTWPKNTLRLRLKMIHTHHFMDKQLRFKFLLGGRYDMAYNDSYITKYDRLVPEAWLDMKWKTPWKRLAFVTVGKVKYNYYLNSGYNEINSFRPNFYMPGQTTDKQNGSTHYNETIFADDALVNNFKNKYYELSRVDFEWELTIETQLTLWKRAKLAFIYMRHQRYSNIDSAPVPAADFDMNGIYERVESPHYGYQRDTFFLELRQNF